MSAYNEDDYALICRTERMSPSTALGIRVTLLILCILCEVHLAFALPLLMVSFSFLGISLVSAYLIMYLCCECRRPTELATRKAVEIPESYAFARYTAIVYQVALVANVLILVVFWGYLIPFFLGPSMDKFRGEHGTVFIVEFLLMHIFPPAALIGELYYNNIRLTFRNIVYPLVVIGGYGFLMLVALMFVKTPAYPMGNSNWTMALFYVVCLGIVLGSQWLVSKITANKTYAIQ